MARHRKFDLLNIVVKAIKDSQWGVLYIGDINHHPFLLRIYDYQSDKSISLRLYIWNLTHGGGSKRPATEYRIQITGVEKFLKKDNEKTLILGWWDQAKIFSGFDFSKHSEILGLSPSIQIKEDALRKAHINGLAVANKGNGEIAVAFRPDFLIHYIETLEEIHKIGESVTDFKIVEKILDNPNNTKVNDALIEDSSSARRVSIATINKKIRDSSFKSRVLTAYSFECAFCGLQLKLIDAAHIVPVSHSTSSDLTSNGIALCALHHRAFDKALITFNEEYQIITNEKDLRDLANSGHDGKIMEFRQNLKPLISLPPSISDRPHIDYIQEANQIRGWG